MNPTKFPQANRLLTAPAGMPNCGDLHTYSDGRQCISKWRASWRERLAVLFTGNLWLWVVSGPTQPPVALMTDEPQWAPVEPETKKVLSEDDLRAITRACARRIKRNQKRFKVGLNLLILAAMTLVAQAGSEVTIAWDPNPVDDVVLSYELYQSTNVAGPFKLVATKDSPETSATLTNVAPAQLFWFAIARNAWGVSSDRSNIISTPPGVPARLNVSMTMEGGALKLFWTPSKVEEQVLKYIVYRANGGPSATFFPVMETHDPVAIFVGLDPSQYTFTVTAVNVWGESMWSEIVTTPPNRPEPVRGLRIMDIRPSK